MGILYQALVAIPLGTVFLEELAFWGIVLGRLRPESLLAPVLAPITTNSISIVSVWAVLH